MNELFRVDHTAIAVRDFEKSRAFYELLGGRVVSKPSPHFMEIVVGELRLHMISASAIKEGEGQPGIDHLCVRVDSCDRLKEICALLNERGLYPDKPYKIEDSPPLGPEFAQQVEERPPLKTLYIKDPDGITIEIRAYR